MADKKKPGRVKPEKGKTGNFTGYRLVIFFAAVTTICAAVCAALVIHRQVELAAAKQELAALPETPDTRRIVWSDINTYSQKMLEINPDYVGVLSISNTAVSYPVVRGEDNVEYLSTSFKGKENTFGGLFMDYRCVEYDQPHIIIYGHHAQDIVGNREFFGGLDVFLDDEYRKEHSEITFIGNDHISVFEIFSARVTDTDDPAYQLDFSEPDAFESFIISNGAPSYARQILTLSTCYGDGSDNKRIIVQGVRKSMSELGDSMTMFGTYQ